MIKDKVLFDTEACTIFQPNSEVVKFTRKRVNNRYMIDLNDLVHDNLCLTVRKDNLTWLWHRRLGHASYNVIHKLMKYEMVKGLPEIFLRKIKYFVNFALKKNSQENHSNQGLKIYLQNLLNLFIWIYLVPQDQ